jgi:biotin carboxyl carrier protein
MASRRLTLAHAGRELVIEILDDQRVSIDGRVIQLRREPDGTIRFEGRSGVAWIATDRARRWVFLDGRVYEFKVERSGSSRSGRRTAPQQGEPASAHHAVKRGPGALAAPMPATVLRVAVSVGDAVRRGDTVIILEAMKMELPVRATGDGQVKAVHCREGDLVDAGETLIEIAD